MAGKKLLVADDSLTIQKVIRLALSNEGYEIQAISDGADALQQISVFRPDLVLIDVSLPTRTAFEIKRELNGMEDFQNTRFILMSSAFEKIDETQASEVEFHGRLTKPFDPAHLRQVLQDVLNGSTAPTPKKNEKTKSDISLVRLPSNLPPRGFPSAPSGFPSLEKTQPGIQLEPPSPMPQNPDPTTQLKVEDFEEELTPIPVSKVDEPADEGISISFESSESSDLIEKTDPHGNQKDEIKHLTESTIRMSGLDDFDWTVNDANLKPPASMDDGGTGFIMKPQFSEESEAPQGMPPISQTRSAASGNTGGFKRASQNIHSPPPLPAGSPSGPIAGSMTGQMSHGGRNVSTEEIEELVKQQVQQTLTEMAQKILPEVAERVIKAEIHRLLNEKF